MRNSIELLTYRSQEVVFGNTIRFIAVLTPDANGPVETYGSGDTEQKECSFVSERMNNELSALWAHYQKAQGAVPEAFVAPPPHLMAMRLHSETVVEAEAFPFRMSTTGVPERIFTGASPNPFAGTSPSPFVFEDDENENDENENEDDENENEDDEIEVVGDASATLRQSLIDVLVNNPSRGNR
jgi:hypothetical protein